MQTLDQSKSYYRRITSLDVITLLLIIGLALFPQGFLLSLLLIVVYPFSHSKVRVSDFGDKGTQIWVRKMDWDKYRKNHQISGLAQYSSNRGSNVHMKQA